MEYMVLSMLLITGILSSVLIVKIGFSLRRKIMRLVGVCLMRMGTLEIMYKRKMEKVLKVLKLTKKCDIYGREYYCTALSCDTQ
jgi:hypothetical protein